MTTQKHEIKVYQRTYSLPILAKELEGLQEDIRSRSTALQEGYITVTKRRLIFTETVRQKLTFEQRYDELDKLVKNYDLIIATLNTHQQEYQTFFGELAEEISEIVNQKCQQIVKLEEKRLKLERLAKSEQDNDLLQVAADQKNQLLQTARTFGYATILMLKKLELMSASLEKIANDQQTQRQVLETMVKKLGIHRQVYDLQREINKLQAEAAEMAKVALDFEQYMEKFLGSFQTLLNNVAIVDKDLSSAMSEIQQIANLVLNQNATNMAMNDRNSQKILDFLVAGNMKKDRLLEALEQARSANIAVNFDLELQAVGSQKAPLEDCLENIQAYINFELQPVLAPILEKRRLEERRKLEEERKKEAQRLQRLEEERKKEAQRLQHLEEERKKEVQRLQRLIEWIDVEGGSFQMGSDQSDREKPIHKVNIKAFRISKYPVTQAQYQAVMGDNPSYFKGDDLPVENVSWNNAKAFCKQLSQMIGQEVRLPSEAEWEYAARGGNKSQGYTYAGSNDLNEVGWYNQNSGSKIHPVGQKKPNELGIYDMSGNVWEWCEDVWHDNYNDGAPTDGSAWITEGDQEKRLLRGGSWDFTAINCRSARRNWDNLGLWLNSRFGFRVVVSFL